MPGSLQRRNVPFVKVQQRFVTIMTSDLAGTRTSSPSSMAVDWRMAKYSRLSGKPLAHAAAGTALALSPLAVFAQP
jgi:hypothetical protein